MRDDNQEMGRGTLISGSPITNSNLQGNLTSPPLPATTIELANVVGGNDLSVELIPPNESDVTNDGGELFDARNTGPPASRDILMTTERAVTFTQQRLPHQRRVMTTTMITTMIAM